MSSITRQRQGKYVYLDESESFWDRDKKKPRNRKTRIGKIDLLSGEPVYKKEYIDRLAAEGKDVGGMRLWERDKEVRGMVGAARVSTDAAKQMLDSVKAFGAMYLLRGIAESTGLLSALREALPRLWERVFVLACYLICSDKPIMYCDDWAAAMYGANSAGMSSQRASDTFAAISYADRNAFYKAWYRQIASREYAALDITSISSYSGGIDECEWGHNRDGEKLPQVNICMLFGEQTKLPVYQTVYSGSLGDVTTLEATSAEFDALTGGADLTYVMDKGFNSANNVRALIGGGKRKEHNFLMAMPFTSNFTKELVDRERGRIDQLENVVLTSGSPIRGVHRLVAWPDGPSLHTLLYFNPVKSIKDRNDLYDYVTRLKAAALADPFNKKLAREYRKYLIVRRSKKASGGATVNFRKDAIDKELDTSGWFIIVSNCTDDVREAYAVYRAKDVVEKSFWKYKNSLGLDRLRVHGSDRMHNKLLVSFIALVLVSHVYNVMKEKRLAERMTFDRLILTMSKLRVATVNGTQVLSPVTKEQADILAAFGLVVSS